MNVLPKVGVKVNLANPLYGHYQNAIDLLNYFRGTFQVWASKWNERAYVSCRKAKLNHDDLCMAVLVQEVINADYAFVSHTRNPISGNPSEIYTEVSMKKNLLKYSLPMDI